MNIHGIRWLFFDVGSTLVDETEAYNHRIREMIQGTAVTFEEFDYMRAQFARQGFNGDAETAKYFGLSKTPWHSEDETPYAGAEATLAELKKRGYCIGIIANQTSGVSDRLKNWGLLKYMDVIAASAELGVSKPDKEIFERALEMADCKPAEAVMIGDRLDNDIVPANATGMATVWIKKGLAVYQNPNQFPCVPDFTVETLSELLDIFP